MRRRTTDTERAAVDSLARRIKDQRQQWGDATATITTARAKAEAIARRADVDRGGAKARPRPPARIAGVTVQDGGDVPVHIRTRQRSRVRLRGGSPKVRPSPPDQIISKSTGPEYRDGWTHAFGRDKKCPF